MPGYKDPRLLRLYLQPTCRVGEVSKIEENINSGRLNFKRDVEFFGNFVSDDVNMAMSSLFESFSSLPKLKSLRMSGYCGDGSMIQTLGRILNQSTTLESMHITYVYLDDATMQDFTVLTKALSRNSRLTDLKIKECKFFARQQEQQGGITSSSSRRRSSTSSSVADMIVKAVSQLSSLQELDLAPIDPFSLGTLSTDTVLDLISSSANLTKLALHGFAEFFHEAHWEGSTNDQEEEENDGTMNDQEEAEENDVSDQEQVEMLLPPRLESITESLEEEEENDQEEVEENDSSGQKEVERSRPLLLESITEALERNQNLLEFHTQVSFYDEQHSQAVARLVKTNTTLRKLTLFIGDSLCSETSNANCIEIAKALKSNATLTDILLYAPKQQQQIISFKTLEAFANMMEYNMSLTALDLFQAITQPNTSASVAIANGTTKLISKISYFLKLNQKGRRELIESCDKNDKEQWLNKILEVQDDLDCLYYFLSASPTTFCSG